jgi:hypothetical protein
VGFGVLAGALLGRGQALVHGGQVRRLALGLVGGAGQPGAPPGSASCLSSSSTAWLASTSSWSACWRYSAALCSASATRCSAARTAPLVHLGREPGQALP